MLLKEFINEVIDTSQIDLQSRKVLDPAFRRRVDGIVKYLSKSLTLNKDENGEVDYENYYEQLENAYVNASPSDKTMFRNTILSSLSQVLTDLVREHLQSVIGRSRNPDEYISKTINYTRVWVSNVKDGTKGGHYDEKERMIWVIVDNKDIDGAVIQLIREETIGSLGDKFYQKFIKDLSATFVHEYAHLEQDLMDPRQGPKFDRGYITTGAPSRVKKDNKKSQIGKRGGVLRYPERSHQDRLRYLGNQREIDSFASGAASELLQDILSDQTRLSVNDALQYIYDNLKYGDYKGSSSSKSFWFYDITLSDIFNGYYKELGIDVNTKEMQTVYKRFLKLVYQKLKKYETKSYLVDNPEWKDIAENNPRSDAISLIAQETLDRIANTARSSGETVEEVIKEIKEGFYTFDAEGFLIDFYKIGQDKEEYNEKFRKAFRDYVAKLYSSYEN